MPKVINSFYCRFENKNYKKGQEYTGTRTDLKVYLEAEKPKKKKATPKKENKNGSKAKIEKK